MAAPRVVHQIVLSRVFVQLDACAREHDEDCLVLPAPVDVQLDRDNRTMVQPDIVAVCDRKIVIPERMFGAPEFLVEILSPSTGRKDMTIKLRKYHNAGVREYWIVDPDERMVIVYLSDGDPEDQSIIARIYDFTQMVPVGISGGTCSVNFTEVARALDRLDMNS